MHFVVRLCSCLLPEEETSSIPMGLTLSARWSRAVVIFVLIAVVKIALDTLLLSRYRDVEDPGSTLDRTRRRMSAGDGSRPRGASQCATCPAVESAGGQRRLRGERCPPRNEPNRRRTHPTLPAAGTGAAHDPPVGEDTVFSVYTVLPFLRPPAASETGEQHACMEVPLHPWVRRAGELLRAAGVDSGANKSRPSHALADAFDSYVRAPQHEMSIRITISGGRVFAYKESTPPHQNAPPRPGRAVTRGALAGSAPALPSTSAITTSSRPCLVTLPPPSPRTDRTRLVPPLVLTGHSSSFPPY